MFREIILNAYWSKEIWDDYWSVIYYWPEANLFIFASLTDICVLYHCLYWWRHHESYKLWLIFMTSFSFKILFYLFRKGNIRQNNPLEHKNSTTSRSKMTTWWRHFYHYSQFSTWKRFSKTLRFVKKFNLLILHDRVHFCTIRACMIYIECCVP